MTIEHLKKFCGPSYNERYATPWSVGGESFATDGFILIRVPRLDEVPERSDAVDLRSLLAGNPIPEQGWVDVPGVEELNIPECPRCKGKPSPSETCPECDGEGVVDFGNQFHDYECECKSCDGEGDVGGCSTCGGDGHLAKEARTHLVGAKFKTVQLLNLLQTFGPIQVTPPSPTGHCSWFRFEGGHALLMPIVEAAR